MFLHKSILIHEVRVQNPDPVFGEKLLEQYGGATGELTAALTYLTQSYHTDNPGIRDMLQDIATEEFGHLEVVALVDRTAHEQSISQSTGQSVSKHAVLDPRSRASPGRFEGPELGRALRQ